MQAGNLNNQNNWVAKFKEFISGFSSEFSILLLKYLVVGFVFGFLLKTFGRFVVFSTLVAFLSIWLLDMAGLISINYAFIESILGISSQETVTSYFSVVVEWVKDNLALFVAWCLGFYLAWELG